MTLLLVRTLVHLLIIILYDKVIMLLVTWVHRLPVKLELLLVRSWVLRLLSTHLLVGLCLLCFGHPIQLLIILQKVLIIEHLVVNLLVEILQLMPKRILLVKLVLLVNILLMM